MIPLPLKRLLRALRARARHMIFYSILVFVLTLFLGAASIYLAEHGRNPGIKNFFDALWFTMETITTVGYGDIVPVTTIGKVVDMVIMPLGISSISILTASIAGAIINAAMARSAGLGSSKSSGHLLIIGWNDRASKLIGDIKVEMDRTGHYLDLVLISSQERPPSLPNDVAYIKGNPFNERDLRRAGADKARTIIIMPLDFSDPYSSDAKVTLVTMIVKQINPQAHVVSEVLDEGNVVHAKRAGADVVISSGSLSTMAMAREAIYGGAADAIMELLMPKEGGEIVVMPPGDFAGKSFLDAMVGLKESKNYMLIGISRAGKSMINPPGNTIIEERDGLIVIKK